MLVRIVKDWPYPESFFGQTPGSDGVWGDITFTEEPVEHCDYLIVLQRPPYPIRATCPKGNVWLITQEPPVPYFHFFTRAFKYFDRVYTNFQYSHPFIRNMQPVLPWHVLRNYQYLNSLTRDKLAGKKDEIVWITSNKRGFPGQTERMNFKNFLQASNFPFHLYGRGFTPIEDKFDGMFPCKYAVSVENFSHNHYWTEKIADAFLSWCLPFYWGASNLEDYFPAESFIRIDISQPEKALDTMRAAISNREWERRLPAIEKARNLILNEYQFFPFLSKMITEDKKNHPDRPKKEYYIPTNPYPWSYTLINFVRYYGRRFTRFDWS